MIKTRTALKAAGWLTGLYIAQAVAGFVGGVAFTLYTLFSGDASLS